MTIRDIWESDEVKAFIYDCYEDMQTYETLSIPDAATIERLLYLNLGYILDWPLWDKYTVTTAKDDLFNSIDCNVLTLVNEFRTLKYEYDQRKDENWRQHTTSTFKPFKQDRATNSDMLIYTNQIGMLNVSDKFRKLTAVQNIKRDLATMLTKLY